MDKINLSIINKYEAKCSQVYKELERICMINSNKVLNAFHKHNISESHFYSSTGYGYNDLGRDAIEEVYATIFSAEDALVRSQFISGTHALTIALNAMLRPGDIMLSITGKPYDTLDEVIGIKHNESSLISYHVQYNEIDLINNDFDYNKIEKFLINYKLKLIHIQRSKGYSTRKSIDIDKLENVIKFIRKIDKNVIIMVDNCYCEFVSTKEPIEVGANIAVGSLIKNLGGGIASNGAYIVGDKRLVKLCAERLNVPGQGKEVGPSMEQNRNFLKGLYLAPSVVMNSLKVSTLLSYIMSCYGYEVDPKYNETKADIVLNITFNDPEKLIKFCQIVQSSSAIDANYVPIPTDMPGYDDKIIMASGSFTQGSSIEMSCDGPIRPPYMAYFQGSLTYEYGKIMIMKVINEMLGE